MLWHLPGVDRFLSRLPVLQFPFLGPRAFLSDFSVICHCITSRMKQGVTLREAERVFP